MTPGLKLPGTRRHYSGLAASLLLHGLVLGGLVLQGERLWSRDRTPGAAAVAGNSSGGGGGRNRVAYITLPSIPEPASPPSVRVTAPAPPPKLVQTPVPQPVPADLALLEPADTAPGVADSGQASTAADTGATGGGAGAGRAAGVGVVGTAGQGGASGAGEGGTHRPPEPRELPLPYDTPPKALRGASLMVTFWVRVDGRVERYEVEPKINDREYAKKFDEVMRAFRFTPARAPDGRSVAGVAKISFILPGKSSS